MNSAPNTPANGGQILTPERISELWSISWNTAITEAGVGFGNADVAHMKQPIHFARAIEADLRASLAAPATENAPNGIAATMRHDAGAFARCSYCRRYSIDPATLSDRQPVCDCGKQHGWCGSFVRPDANSTWSGKSPAAPAIHQPASALTDERNAVEGEGANQTIYKLMNEHFNYGTVYGEDAGQYYATAGEIAEFACAAMLAASPKVAPAIPTVDRNSILEEAAMLCYASAALYDEATREQGIDPETKNVRKILRDECDSLKLAIRALKSAAPASVPPAGMSEREHFFWKAGRASVGAPVADIAQPAAPTDEPTDREALIACLEDDAAKLADANPDDEMAQTMRDAAAMLEADGAQPAAQVAVSQCSYRKKPVVIEAIEYTGSGNFANPYLPEWMWKALESGTAFNRNGELIIKTLEGEHLASPGDWIICGVKGEIYPCKPEIFTLTYERATPATVKTAEKSDTQQEKK